jgi:oxygen-independent coproporphyrinogen-3 oxidase
VGLYLHVPFCRSICTYCAFARGEYVEALAERWLDGVAREVTSRAASSWRGRPALDTVFLGGGTPSTLPPRMWRRLGEILHGAFEILPSAEFTSEANPESLRPEVVEAMRGIGVNRVSLGVQSLDPGELALLGRAHGVGDVARAVRTAREGGIANLNLDLMYALPGQAETTFLRSLRGVLDLEPDHVSAYCLSFEPGTPMAEDREAGRVAVAPDDLSRRLYEVLLSETGARDYGHYEISNVARAGRECRHNLRYWRRQDVLALGPSAHAFAAGQRWANPAPLEAWLSAYAPGGRPPRPQPVPPDTARFEWVFLRLRLTEGFTEEAFLAAWGESFEARYGAVAAPLVRGGLLSRDGGRVRLTEAARFVSDGVLAEFAP